MVVGREFSLTFLSSRQGGGGGSGSKVEQMLSSILNSQQPIGKNTETFLMIIPKTSPTMPCESECDDWSKADLRKLSVHNK